MKMKPVLKFYSMSELLALPEGPTEGTADDVFEYKCQRCHRSTRLTREHCWGKVIRCNHCAAIVKDNRAMHPPAQ